MCEVEFVANISEKLGALGDLLLFLQISNLSTISSEDYDKGYDIEVAKEMLMPPLRQKIGQDPLIKTSAKNHLLGRL